MSKVKFTHASGNSMSIAAPASNPASNLELKLPSTVGTSGQVLQTDGSGNLSWVTLSTDTYFPTHYDTWNLGANKNWSGTNFLDGDFDRNTTMASFGAAMTRSGTVMSFPTTGYWEICFQAAAYDTVDNSHTQIWVDRTNDNGSNWSTITNSFSHITTDGSNDVYGGSFCQCMLDVTDVSNVKVRLGTNNEQGAVFRGHTTCLITGAIFKRIGDT
jgi:hypothetical protein